MVKSSILIPTFNSEKTISKLVCEILELFKNESIEIILINDGSIDKTDEKCQNLKKKFVDKITYLKLMKNVGEHNAIMAGLNFTDSEVTFIMADDFQNPPSELKKLYDYTYENNYDVVYAKYKERKYSLFKNFTSKIVNIFAYHVLSKPKNIYLNSFKSIKKNVIKKIITYSGPEPYIDGLIFNVTKNIGQVEVDHFSGKNLSRYTFKKMFKLFSNFFFNFSLIPIRLLIISGFIIQIFALIYSIAIILEKINDPNMPTGYASLIVILLFCFGFNFLFLGIIGEYIGRILKMVNSNPQYTIDKKFLRKDS